MADAAVMSRLFESLALAAERGAEESKDRTVQEIVAAVDRQIVNAIGSDRVLSGTTRTTGGRKRSGKPREMRPYVDNLPDGRILVGVKGPLQLVENDVAKHPVTSRHAKGDAGTRINKKGKTVKARSTRESRARNVLDGVALTGGDRRAVLHWGDNYARYTYASSKGKQPWRKGVTSARAQMPAIHTQATRRALTDLVTR